MRALCTLLAWATVAFLGCNGVPDVSNGNSSGGGGGGGGDDSRSESSVSVAACPNDPPIGSSSSSAPNTNRYDCYNEGRVCEYGTDPDPQCNQYFVCDAQADGSAFVLRPGKTCASNSLNTPNCPSSPPPVNSPCTLDANTTEGRLCAGADRATCTCTTGPDGDHVHAPTWICAAPDDKSCPAERPLLGQACDAARSCDYGSCAFKHGIRVECTGTGGFWREATTECP